MTRKRKGRPRKWIRIEIDIDTGEIYVNGNRSLSLEYDPYLQEIVRRERKKK